MQDQSKTKQQLIAELQQLRQQIAELQVREPYCAAEVPCSDWGVAIRNKECEAVRLAGVSAHRQPATIAPKNLEILEQERDLLQAVINGACNCHLVYLDREFNFVRVNEAYARICGYAPEEMIGKNHFVLYPHAENEAIFTRVRDTGIPAEFHDKPFIYPDQPERGVTYWDWTLVPVRDSTGEVTGLVFSLIETTERKRAEEALRESEERFRVFMNNNPAVAWIKDEHGRYVYLNQTCENRFGVKLEEFLGKTDFELWPPEIAERWWQNDQAVLSSGRVVEIEEKAPDADGGCSLWLNVKFPFQDAAGNRYIGGIGTDITARKQAEEDRERLLQEIDVQRARLQATLDAIPVGVWITDAEGKMIMINEFARDIWGGKAPYLDSVEDYTEYKVWWADTGALVAAEDYPLIRAIRGQVVKDRIFEFERFDGTRGTQVASAAPVRDTDGQIVGSIGIVQDITPLKQAEEALRESEERFINLFERAPLGYQSLNADGRFIEVNEAWLTTLGYNREEVIGKWFGDLLAPEFVEEFRERFLIFKTSERIHSEFQMLHKSGERRFIAFDGRIGRKKDGSFEKTHCIIQDITERKQMEEALRDNKERLRLALDAAHMATWDWDITSGSLIWNEEHYRMWGYAPGEVKPSYQAWAARLHPEDRVHVETLLRRSMKWHSEVRAEFRVLWPNGTVHWVEARGRSESDAAGKAARSYGVLIDITERKQAEEMLCKINATLEERIRDRTAALRKSRERFRQLSSELLQAQENERKRVANEIHDNAGQVLTAVKYRVEGALLKMGKEAPDLNLKSIKELVPMIQHCVDDMRRLQMDLRPSMLDEMGLLSTIRWFCRQFHLTHPSIRVEQEITVDEADIPEQLKIVIFRVLQEAMHNAGKHSDAEWVSLSLQKKNGSLTFRLEDDGRGFDLEEAHRVQAFNKGLGLSSMRERVQYSGGTALH